MLCGTADWLSYVTATSVAAGASSDVSTKLKDASAVVVTVRVPAAGDAPGEPSGAGLSGAGDGSVPSAPSLSAMSIGSAPTPAGTRIVSPATAGQPLMPAGDCIVQTSSPVSRSSANMRPSYVDEKTRSLIAVTAPRAIVS